MGVAGQFPGRWQLALTVVSGRLHCYIGEPGTLPVGCKMQDLKGLIPWLVYLVLCRHAATFCSLHTCSCLCLARARIWIIQAKWVVVSPIQDCQFGMCGEASGFRGSCLWGAAPPLLSQCSKCFPLWGTCQLPLIHRQIKEH